MQYWDTGVPTAAWVTICLVAIVIITVFVTLGYAEEEFFSSLLKLLVVVMFIFIGIICVCGGGPSSGMYGDYSGGKLWADPGAFNAECVSRGAMLLAPCAHICALSLQERLQRLRDGRLLVRRQ